MSACKAVTYADRVASIGEMGLDHVPFLEVGIPAVDLIDFRYGSAPGRNDYWHTTEDTMDKLSPDSLDKVGRVTLRMVFDLAAASAPPAE